MHCWNISVYPVIWARMMSGEDETQYCLPGSQVHDFSPWHIVGTNKILRMNEWGPGKGREDTIISHT